jgi:hypothetical protein
MWRSGTRRLEVWCDRCDRWGEGMEGRNDHVEDEIEGGESASQVGYGCRVRGYCILYDRTGDQHIQCHLNKWSAYNHDDQRGPVPCEAMVSLYNRKHDDGYQCPPC